MPAYARKHTQTLLRESPFFEYPDEEPEECDDVEEDAPCADQASAAKQWRANVHPGPLLVAKHRKPDGGYFGDSSPFYHAVLQPTTVDDLVPFDGRTLNPGGAGAHARDEEKKDAGVNYPWLTAYERRARGIDVDAADGELLEKFRGCRKDDGGGFWQLETGMEKITAVKQ
ncbi:uncharacterized protein MICPUCDRAFT_60086 [Micromonas pusilla CCMP1545]|uniref:Predicted protein n=1 Tax=Micromonas pusilla (strain CCMP1545) TaxID=564608 RepID=C1MXA6_MICPC|nr:uncharacterized protein MICPUCDRAFT_60086 [Micromonas pusilla CCMP1545]EEH55428.1 predicted protein [Micromonas pusilla CCMP1545]|eukprot:XP_003060659.1 predicted protein [Micromonas pusilla CCMP1545]